MLFLLESPPGRKRRRQSSLSIVCTPETVSSSYPWCLRLDIQNTDDTTDREDVLSIQVSIYILLHKYFLCAICFNPFGAAGDCSRLHGRDTTYTFKDKINCKITNVVYGVICQKCDELKYVGETGTTIYERIENHLTTIRKKKKNTIAQHFNMKDHKLQDFTIIGIEQIKKKRTPTYGKSGNHFGSKNYKH